MGKRTPATKAPKAGPEAYDHGVDPQQAGRLALEAMLNEVHAMHVELEELTARVDVLEGGVSDAS